LGRDSGFVFNKIPEEGNPLPCSHFREITRRLPENGSASGD